MSPSAQDLAREAALYRESGHRAQAARLLSLAKDQFPGDPRLTREEQRLHSPTRLPRVRALLSTVVDRLGVPLTVLVMIAVVWLLAPIVFVPSW